MKLLLKRIAKNDTYTIGKLYINGIYMCDTIEDVDRGLNNSMSVTEINAKKVYGQTAIPTGKYKIILTYSNHFKKVMPLLLMVKGYEGVRIHSGNSAEDSLGCIIVGENKVKGKVINSRLTYDKLYKLLELANNQKEYIEISIE